MSHLRFPDSLPHSWKPTGTWKYFNESLTTTRTVYCTDIPATITNTLRRVDEVTYVTFIPTHTLDKREPKPTKVDRYNSSHIQLPADPKPSPYAIAALVLGIIAIVAYIVLLVLYLRMRNRHKQQVQS
ncbi:hypothetical protein NLU13_9564 [Sarocladium strictum]|uniref:Uncharacterized protein n=1 Tax=Sarocladium strictum TaxID=5046 RepID=A0AA39GBG4_SARSR|nr:hypothetical protein NLU13_9564 [Sarocladium strictum]